MYPDQTNAYTTIEHCEKYKAKKTKENGDNKKVADLWSTSPFDTGFWGNVCDVLGPNPLLWLVPVTFGMHSGDLFEYDHDHDLIKTK